MKVNIGRASRHSAEYCDLGRFERRRLNDHTVESFERVSAQLEQNIELPRKVTVVFDDGNSYRRRGDRVPAATAGADGVVSIMPGLYRAYAIRERFVDGITGHELSHISDWHTGNLKTYRTFFEKMLTEGKAKHVEREIVNFQLLDRAGYRVVPVSAKIVDPLLLKYDKPTGFLGRAMQLARAVFEDPAAPELSLPVEESQRKYVMGFHLVDHALAQTGMSILELHPSSNAEIAQAAFDHIRALRE